MVLAGLLCSESHETEVKVSAGLTSYLESLGGEKNLLLGSLRLLGNRCCLPPVL